MPHVVFDHQIFSSTRYGGVSRYFFELARGLPAASEFSAEIIAPLHYNDYIGGGAVTLTGVKVPALPKGYRLIQPINQVISPALIRRAKPDIVHETYYQVRSVAPKNCPIILTAYDLIHERWKTFFRPGDTTTQRKRAAIKRATHIIAISHATKRDFMEFFGLPEEAISVVHLGYARPQKPMLEGGPRPNTGQPYILFVGNRRGHKNFERLLEAFFSSPALNSSHRLVAFGGGGLTTGERERILRLGGRLDQVIQLPGNDDVLFDLYSRANLFVYPSLYEGFGLPPLEAMSFGCPVVCSNSSSIPEVVGDAALLFDPVDVDAIREAMEQVIFSSDIRQRLTERGVQRCEQFSWRSCVERTAEVYRSVAS